MGVSRDPDAPIVVGRYKLFDEIGSGGMASVHIGRLVGPAGFGRTVAVKKLHPHYANEADFVGMLLDEARLAACIRHPNVASILDVVHSGDDVMLVMEYVSGESLSRLQRRILANGGTIPVPIAVAWMAGVLEGLHAAHEATSPGGEALGIIHRDVSPQNVMIGDDGVARVIDFGVAKAAWRVTSTRDGQVKGKSGYMAPEQLMGKPLDRRVDVFAASVVLWEVLTRERLFYGQSDGETVLKVLQRAAPPPSSKNRDVTAALDEVVLRGLSREPDERFDSAHEMAGALEAAARPASPRDVANWVKAAAGEGLVSRQQRVAAIEGGTWKPLPSAAPRRELIPIEESTTVAASEMVASSPRPARLALNLTLAAVLGAIAVFTALRVGRAPDPPSAATPAAKSAEPFPRPPVAAAPAPATPVVGESPQAPSTGSSPSIAASQAPASPSGSSAAAPQSPSPVVPAPRAPAPKHHATAAPNDCNPPYTVDSNGIHVAKPQCI